MRVEVWDSMQYDHDSILFLCPESYICTWLNILPNVLTLVFENWFLRWNTTGCPAKKFTFFKSAYLRPLISLRKSSILEMNLWISSFKSTKSEFSRIFRFRAIKGIKHMLHFSRYIWLTFEPSEMSNYSKMACIWPKMIIFQV